MAISRREFLQRSALVAAGSAFGPNLLGSPFAEEALAQSLGDRYFVSFFLNGGNDGLNTVVPLADGPPLPSILDGGLRTAYAGVRDSLRLSPWELEPQQIDDDPVTGTALALHPALAGFKDLYDRGVLAVLQGCGYPEPNLSHDASTRKWQTAQPLGPTGSLGWIGRHLASQFDSNQIPAVSASDSIAGELRQAVTNVLGISRLDRFGFPRDRTTVFDHAAKDVAFAALYGSARDSEEAMTRRVGAAGDATFAATQLYPALLDEYASDRPDANQAYLTGVNTTKRRMRDIAAYIHGAENGTVQSRFFQVSLGGFDTHSNQGTLSGNHNRRLETVAEALQIFYDDVEDMGVADRVCVLVWSEFSRRIRENSNDGTDHGTQGPMFVIGGSVYGGLYGAHPDINQDALNRSGNTPYSQDPGDPFRSIDFRDVYGTLLRHWFGVPNPGAVLPTDNPALDPGRYWLESNFDLGFLA